MAKKIRFKEWAKFGATIGIVFGIVVFILTSIIGGALRGFEGLLLGGVVGIAIIVGLVVINALSWIIGGAIYDLFLVNILKKFDLRSQIIGMGIALNIGTSITFGTLNIISGIISAIISGFILAFIIRKLKIKHPFKVRGR